MKAWQIHQYGGNEELSLSATARIPSIQSPKDILVEVHAASVNPIDVNMRDGYGRKLINTMRRGFGTIPSGAEFPLTLGRDFSGVIKETGRGVSRFKPGDEIWGALASHRQGTHAQYTIAGETEISPKPTSISHVEAASIPYVATTTWSALCTAGELTENNTALKRVLIHGGSGGIGTFAIQLMKAWQANVTTTCSTDAVDLVRSLQADTIIDYKSCDVARELAKLEKFDVILDPLGGETPSFSVDLLKSWTNAKYVSLVMPLLPSTDKYGIPGGLIQSATDLSFNVLKGFSRGRSYRWGLFMPNGNALRKVAKLVDSGDIRPVIDEVFSLEELPRAFEKVGQKHGRGKTVIDMMKEKT